MGLPAGDPRLPAGDRREVRVAPIRAFRPACRPRAMGRRRIPLARLHQRRPGIHRPIPDLGCRRAAHTVRPRRRRTFRIRAGRWRGIPFGSVGPQRRHRTQAGRCHRHRRQRHPDRPGNRRRGGATTAVSTHPGMGHAEAQQRDSGGPAKGVRHDPGHSCVAASTHLLDPRVGGFRDDPAAGDFETR